MTTDGPRVAEKGKVDHIPGVAFVAGRKYFKGIGEKKKKICPQKNYRTKFHKVEKIARGFAATHNYGGSRGNSAGHRFGNRGNAACCAFDRLGGGKDCLGF